MVKQQNINEIEIIKRKLFDMNWVSYLHTLFDIIKQKGVDMQVIRIEVSNSIYEHILFFLQNLPKNLITISHETKKYIPQEKSIKDEIKKLFATHPNIKPFQEIKNPIDWQRSIRDEWE